MSENENTTDDLSISLGGPFNRILERLRLSTKQKKLVVIGLMITWLPLLILTIFEGTVITGVDQPF